MIIKKKKKNLSYTLDNIEFGEWKVNTLGEGLDARPQFSLRQRGVLVEEGCNEVRVDGHEEEHDQGCKAPQVDEEVLATPEDDSNDASHQGQSDRLADDKGFDLVLDVEASSLLVEAVLLLENESAVHRERQANQCGHEVEQEHVRHAHLDFRLGAKSYISQQHLSLGPEELEPIQQEERLKMFFDNFMWYF